MTCATCQRPIVPGRYLPWAHAVNPGAAHHEARPAVTCRAPDCDGHRYAKGWCKPHYGMVRRHGIPRPRTFADRFWEKVDKNGPTPAERPDLDPCWLWLGAAGADGYGDIRTSGTGHRSAHRYTYITLVGAIPEGLTLDHLCRVHACCNPAHLEPVTSRENNLRGVSPAAVNARKADCGQGHSLAGDNLIALSRGGRRCKTCHRDSMRARGTNRAEYMRRWRALQHHYAVPARRPRENDAAGVLGTPRSRDASPHTAPPAAG